MKILNENLEKFKKAKGKESQINEILEKIKLVIKQEPNKTLKKKLNKLNEIDIILTEKLEKVNSILNKLIINKNKVDTEIIRISKLNGETKDKLIKELDIKVKNNEGK